MKPRFFFSFTSWDLFHMNLGLYRKVDREGFLGPIQNMWWSWSVIAGVARTSNHPHLKMISPCDETTISQPPGLLDGLLGVAGMMKLRMWWLGSFPQIPCVKRTSKMIILFLASWSPQSCPAYHCRGLSPLRFWWLFTVCRMSRMRACPFGWNDSGGSPGTLVNAKKSCRQDRRFLSIPRQDSIAYWSWPWYCVYSLLMNRFKVPAEGEQSEHDMCRWLSGADKIVNAIIRHTQVRGLGVIVNHARFWFVAGHYPVIDLASLC